MKKEWLVPCKNCSLQKARSPPWNFDLPNQIKILGGTEMNNIKYTINEFDTLKNDYIEVEVTKVVFDCYRRTGWNINKNNQKHAHNTIPFSSLCGPYDINENFTMFASEAENPEQICEAKETSRILIEAIKKLPENEKVVIELIFLKGLTAIETGKL
jgi:hypothetical protein